MTPTLTTATRFQQENCEFTARTLTVSIQAWSSLFLWSKNLFQHESWISGTSSACARFVS